MEFVARTGVRLEEDRPDPPARHRKEDGDQRTPLLQGDDRRLPVELAFSRVCSGGEGRRANADTKALIFSLPTRGRGRLRTPL